jgi:hypothetical protein
VYQWRTILENLNGFSANMPLKPLCGGGLRIRTLGGDKPSTVFKTAAFDHSASPPEIFFSTIQCLRKKRTGLYIDENGTQGAQATCVLVALKSFRTWLLCAS